MFENRYPIALVIVIPVSVYAASQNGCCKFSWTRFYAFMTTTPNSLVATVNHERMPVLLTQPQELDRWMHGSPEAAMELAREYPPEQMQIVQTGYEKEDQLVQQTLRKMSADAVGTYVIQ